MAGQAEPGCDELQFSLEHMEPRERCQLLWRFGYYARTRQVREERLCRAQRAAEVRAAHKRKFKVAQGHRDSAQVAEAEALRWSATATAAGFAAVCAWRDHADSEEIAEMMGPFMDDLLEWDSQGQPRSKPRPKKYSPSPPHSVSYSNPGYLSNAPSSPATTQPTSPLTSPSLTASPSKLSTPTAAGAPPSPGGFPPSTPQSSSASAWGPTSSCGDGDRTTQVTPTPSTTVSTAQQLMSRVRRLWGGASAAPSAPASGPTQQQQQQQQPAVGPSSAPGQQQPVGAAAASAPGRGQHDLDDEIVAEINQIADQIDQAADEADLAPGSPRSGPLPIYRPCLSLLPATSAGLVHHGCASMDASPRAGQEHAFGAGGTSCSNGLMDLPPLQVKPRSRSSAASRALEKALSHVGGGSRGDWKHSPSLSLSRKCSSSGAAAGAAAADQGPVAAESEQERRARREAEVEAAAAAIMAGLA